MSKSEYKPSVDPRFPIVDEDVSLLDSISNTPVRPVFVMGLHRSGTTFLYDCIAKSFPVAHLDLYHLFYYQRLLKNFRDNAISEDRQRLNDYFRQQGVNDRGIDGVEVNATSVEEYGFLLRQISGSFKISATNAALFDQLCRKLLAVQPGSEAVLLKNPWDTGNAKLILERFPNARFVYICREPMSVLNSMLNALLSYLDGPQAYLEMLLSPAGDRSSYRKGYLAWRCLRVLRRSIGSRGVALLHRRFLAKEVARQYRLMRQEIRDLPPACAIEVSYQALTANPAAVMRRLQPLLDMPIQSLPEEALTVKTRHHLNPVLENYQCDLNRLLLAE